MTYNCWRMGRRESHSLDWVLLAALGAASLDARPGGREPESGSSTRTNSGLGGQRRGRRRAGREKHVHTEGQRRLGFPPKMHATAQEAQMRKAWAKLGTGDSSTDRAALGGDGNGPRCSASSPAPSLHAEGHPASPLQGIQPKTQGPSFETMRTHPPLQAVKWGPATAAGGTDPSFQRGC